MAKTITITIEENILEALIDYAFDMKNEYEDEPEFWDWSELREQLVEQSKLDNKELHDTLNHIEYQERKTPEVTGNIAWAELTSGTLCAYSKQNEK